LGTRVKNFEASGLAPDGRLYAGDLNAIQDQYADQANFAQSVDVGNIGIGDSTLRILKYGTGELRLTGALRVDSILRGLGGLYAGAFTTTQRNAIPAGSRPYGLLILNTTTNQYEWNKGSDGTPDWQPVGADSSMQGLPVGAGCDWPWAAASIPSWAILPYGQAISRTTYAALHTLASASAYPYGNGNGSTTFNVPDYRGRIGVGKDDMGGSAANRLTVGVSGVGGSTLGAVGGVEGITLTTGQIPAHNHGGGVHSHGVNDPGHNHGGESFVCFGDGDYSDAAGPDRNYTTSAINVGTTGITIANSGAVINTEGGGGIHSNVQPVVVVNKIIRAM
jgi:microcystin-dependent protein